MRLRTVSCQEPGWRRIRSGRGFRYVDDQGRALSAADVDRVKALVIPPAWNEVWICPHERGHLQVVGTDEAGRRQYLYHPAWREKQDAAKFERVHDMARRLPGVRRKLRNAMTGDAAARETVMAAAVRLVDLGCFRLGSEESADEFGSHGLTTLERRHVRRENGAAVFEFVGKSGIEHEVRIDDAPVLRVLSALTRGRRPSSRLIATRDSGRWKPIAAEAVNAYLRETFDLDVSAKDLRTWHATETVAAALGSVERSDTGRGRARQVRAAVVEASELLGNTPTVARGSYVDPRVIDLFEDGVTIEPKRGEDALTRAVVALLD